MSCDAPRPLGYTGVRSFTFLSSTHAGWAAVTAPRTCAAQSAVHGGGLGPDPGAAAGGLESRAGRRQVAAPGGARDQPRNDLPLYLGRQAGRRRAVPPPARRPQARRERYGHYDSRGRLAGKRPITARPAAVETRRERGHWEADTTRLLAPQIAPGPMNSRATQRLRLLAGGCAFRGRRRHWLC